MPAGCVGGVTDRHQPPTFRGLASGARGCAAECGQSRAGCPCPLLPSRLPLPLHPAKWSLHPVSRSSHPLSQEKRTATLAYLNPGKTSRPLGRTYTRHHSQPDGWVRDLGGEHQHDPYSRSLRTRTSGPPPTRGGHPRHHPAPRGSRAPIHVASSRGSVLMWANGYSAQRRRAIRHPAIAATAPTCPQSNLASLFRCPVLLPETEHSRGSLRHG